MDKIAANKTLPEILSDAEERGIPKETILSILSMPVKKLDKILENYWQFLEDLKNNQSPTQLRSLLRKYNP